MVTRTQKISTQIEVITPKKAQAILAGQNQLNRRIKEAVVRRLASAIESGHWVITHQGLAFNGSGRLLDGQHRLTAIAKAGKPVKMMVTRGLSDSAFRVIDTGASRTSGDHFHLLGYKDSNVLAAVLKMEWVALQHDGDISKRLIPENTPDKQDLEELAEQRPRLVGLIQDESGAGANQSQRNGLMTRTHWIWTYYHVTQADPTLGQEFMDALLSGANLNEGSIVLALRNKLLAITNEVALKRRSAPHAATEKIALVLKTFTRVRDGKEQGKAVVWHRIKGEAFPRLA